METVETVRIGSVQIGEERLADMGAEVAALCAAHWREVEAPLHGAGYCFNAAHYATLESLGMLCILAVREAAKAPGEAAAGALGGASEGASTGTLQGYAAFCLTPCPHRPGQLTARLDGLYLAPTVRKGLTALRLLRKAESLLARRGATSVQYSSPASRPCHALYRRLGARPSESIWQKTLAPATATSEQNVEEVRQWP